MKGRIVRDGDGYGVQVRMIGAWVDEAGLNGSLRWESIAGAKKYAARNGIELMDSFDSSNEDEEEAK